jgi:alanyl-tRNA synthetase
MGDSFPELAREAPQVTRILKLEEERFAETLAAGMVQFDSRMRDVGGKMVPGALVFLLHDTYGFPPDLTADIARERGLSVDMEGYEREMEAQRGRARAASRFGVDQRDGALFAGRSEFRGYEEFELQARIVALLRDGESVETLAAGQQGEVVLDRTPFYAEAGGQIGDTGALTAPPAVVFEVEDTQKHGAAIAHRGRLKSGVLKIGDAVNARIDAERRQAIRLNHSATHLLHAALRSVLGTHVIQKGSLVAADRLRFDFAHFQPVTPDELQRIERLVNGQIRSNDEADTRQMDYEDAIAGGAMALFGEKYDKRVRVLRFGGFSTELCGGTHVARTGDIGFFHIVSESGVAAGVRRIEAITGQAALDYVERVEGALHDVAQLVHGSRADAASKVREALERIRALEKENRALKDKLAMSSGRDLADGAVDVDGVKVLATRVDGADAGALRSALDQLKSRLGSAIIVLGSVDSTSKVLLVAGVTADQTARVRAGELIAAVAAQVGGKGGGRPDFAQAGGSNPQTLDQALASVAPWVRSRLGAATH